MKKAVLLFLLTGLFSIAAEAQTQTHRCFTDEYHTQLLTPEHERNLQELEDFTEQFIRNKAVERSGSNVVYIIPVVFHVLHDYGFENISDAQIHRAMEILNRDFRRLNADTVNAIPIFKPLIADAEIEFRLATKDPFGNCTNGIERHATQKTYFANNDSKTDPSWMVWPNSKYLNIWVAHSLENTGAAAYAHLPGGNPSVDGIMTRHNYVGDIGTASGTNGRTLTHEVGHHFNLLHLWGPGNTPGVTCGDDGVNDTPITKGFDNCSNPSAAICDPNIIENVQNYMEYAFCDVMFTHGQKARMHATLNSSVSSRNNLWTSSNLIATGTDGTPGAVCVPVADFKVNNRTACAGTNLIFTDQSWNSTITSWSWSFPGGTPSSSTDSAATVVYNTAGLYSVSLTVGTSAGMDSITKTSYVRITAAPVANIPFVEDFEGATSFPGIDGWVENYDNASTWTRVTNASATSGTTASIRMNNYNTLEGAVDEWITSSIDFSNVDFPVNLGFKVAHAQRSSLSNDELKIWYSLNCGQTWQSTSYSKSGSSLQTAGIITSNFTPTTPSQWRQENVNVNAVKLKPNVRFKFQNNSNHGNNTFIDEINITGNIVGIDDVDDIQAGFTLYPNPARESATVGFLLSRGADVNIEVRNVLGQTISNVLSDKLNAGTYEYKLPSLAPGIYLIDLVVNNKHHVRKLIVS